MKIVYHCSPVKIEKFDFTNGVHFGGKLSALEAALRHKSEGTLYLHKCVLLVSKEPRIDDLCSAKGWYR